MQTPPLSVLTIGFIAVVHLDKTALNSMFLKFIIFLLISFSQLEIYSLRHYILIAVEFR